MLSYDEWFKKKKFKKEDEKSFQAYEDYVKDYQERMYNEWRDFR